MSISKNRILFVDDEQNVLDGLSRQLRHKKAAWDMTFELEPAVALRVMRDTPADVVVSDMRMPGMSGLDMVVAMREVAPHAVFIMLTGTADLETAVEAINTAGIFRFYTKPCPPELLIEGIEAGLTTSANRVRRGERDGPGDGQLSARAATITEGIGLAALNRLALSVVVVDRDARVLLANNSGGALLSQHDGLVLSGREICRASDTAETEELHTLIEQAADGGTLDEFDAATMAVTRPSSKRPLSVLVAPLPIGGAEASEILSLAVLFVADPERQPLPSPQTIGKVFALTRAEANIVHALARGDRLEQAAEASGVTISTARSYLKQIFSKTNTNRQSELIKLVLAYPSVVAQCAPAEI